MKQIDYLRKSRKNCSALLMACALTFMLLTTTLSFAQTNSLTLGCPTRNGNSYQYQNLSFTTSTDFEVTSISVSFSDDPASCSIALPTLPTGWSVDPSSNDYSKYIILPEGTDDVTIRDFLSGITYTVPDNSIKNVQIILLPVAAGKIIRYSENGHYYQFVPFTEAEANWTWIDCYNAAKGMTYCGRQGYLATLTSLGEDKFVTRLVSSSMWIGGTRLSPTDDATSTGTQYYASFDVEDNNKATTALSGDYWYWACGPEKGTRITNEVTNSNNNTNWYANQPSYSNWCWKEAGFLSSAEFEPNNARHGWGASSSYESCLTILNIGRNSVHNHTEGIGWNDIGYDRNIMGNFSDQDIWLPQGFMVEYGNQIIGDTNPETDECSISASGKVGNANDTSRVTLSGNDTICKGEEATLTLLFEGAYPFTGKVTGGGQEYDFTTNDVFYTFTVTPTETTTYTVSEFSDASSTTGEDGCLGVYNIIYEKLGSATVTVNTPQVALNDIAPVAICAGASTTLTATTTETVTGEVSYAWSTGATGSEITVTPSETTTYTVTATATQGVCTATATKSVTVTVNTPQVTLKDIASVAICAGANTTLTAELDGIPTGNVAYAWSPATGLSATTDATVTANPTSTTTYTVIATANYNGCTATATKSVTVTVNELPTATISVTDALCNGASNGSVELSVSGGTTPYSYAWSNGATTEDLSSVSAGTYTVTVTDDNGCTAATASATVSQPAALTVSLEPESETCAGNDGSVALTVSGGTTPYSYAWSNGDTTKNLSSVPAGPYTVTVTDRNTCVATATATITLNKNFTVSASDTAICSGATFTINPEATHTAKYSWAAPTATGITGATADTNASSISGTLTNITTSETSITYTVTATTANGLCTATPFNVEVTVYAPVTGGSIQKDFIVCNGLDSVVTLTNEVLGNGGFNGGYIWQSVANDTATTIEGANGETYTPTSVVGTVQYQRVYTTGCGNKPSNVVSVTYYGDVNPGTVVCSNGCAANYCYGSDINVTLSTSGINVGSGTTPTIQWQQSVNGGDWTNISGANDTTYTYNKNNFTEPIKFRYTIQLPSCDPVPSNNVHNIGVWALPVVSIAEVATLCPSAASTEITGTIETPTTPNYTYYWSAEGGLTLPTNLPESATSAISNTITGTFSTTDCNATYSASLYVVDGHGCQSNTATETFTVVDTIRPTFTRPVDITIYTNDTCGYDASVSATGDVTNESDNCSTGINATFTDAIADGDCAGKKTITRTWSLVDNCGNSAADQVQTITVLDTIRPTFTRPADITIYADASCGYNADTTITGSVTNKSDNCSTNLTVTYRDAVAEGDCQGKKVITRTWRVVDACGNVSISDSVQTITVEDTIAPTITCRDNFTQNTDNGKPYATVTLLDPIPVDNCSATYSISYSPATPTNATATNASGQYPLGETIVTYSVVDGCGNADSCSFTITVSDNQAPEIACTVTGNQDVLPNSAGNTYTHIGNSWDATATDNVDVVSLTYTLTDATVDNTPKTTLDGQVFNYGTTTVTWKATDNTGASDVCSFQVVVADNTNPVLTCPTITTVYECLAEVPATYANYAAFTAADGTATDNHQINESSFAVTETVTPGCPTTITRTYSIKDMTGNEGTCTQVITVEDKTAPVLKSGSTLPAGESNMSLCFVNIPAGPTVEEIAALYEDNCGGEVIVSKSGTPTGDDCGWNVTYTYVIKDTCNNEAIDTVSYSGKAADFVMPANGTKTVQCIDDATAPTFPVIKDACGTVLEPKTSSMVDSPSPLICEGTRTYTYTYEDCAGHTHDWTYTYTIEHTTAPAEVGGPVATSSTVQCIAAATAPTTLPVVKDVCGNTLEAPTPVEGGTYTDCEGTKTYTYTYKDCSGLEFVWTYTYTIDRTTAPSEVGGPVATSSTVECAAAATAPTTLPVVKDVCGNVIPAPTPVVGGTYTDCEGTKTYTYTYEDCAGLQYVWTYTYTIDRTTAPNEVDGPVATASTVGCIADATAPTTLPVVKDVCGNTLTDPTLVEGGTYTDCEGTKTYTYTYEDCSGLQYVWTYTYTITAPTLTFTGSITDVDDVDACYSESHKSQLLTADQVKAMYSSSCSREITVEISDNVESDNDCNWKITRTYNISDGGCNTDSKTMVVSGSDQTAPAIGTDDLDRTLTATNCVFSIPDMREIVRNISTDCSEITVTQPSAGMVVYPMVEERDTTVNVIVTDSCGNSSVKEVVITIPAKVTISATATPATICYGATSQLTATPSNVVGTATYNWTPSDGLNNATIANPVATLTTTTTYTVEVTDENGCAATATTTVTVNPEVVMDAVAPMTLCVGDVTSYSFTTPLTVGTMSYAWTNSNTAIGLGANGDGNLPSFTPTNTTNAPINATITVTPSHTYNDIICVGDPINFTITVRPSIKTPGNVTFTCPADTTVVLSYSDCEQLVNIGEPEFENYMLGMPVNITNDAPAGNIFPEGTTVVTWTATDECGAFLTCTQNVVIQFPPCGDTIADFDGYRYSSVRIGCQCWTGENARSEHYSDGTPVDNFRYYNDSDSLENIYGKLYTWYTAVRVPEGDNNAEPSGTTDPFGTTYVQGICPEGWALPTVNEYMQMIANSGDATHAKDGSNLYWLPGYEGQPPFSGFDAYGAGKYNGAIDRYQDLLGKTYFWTTLSGSGSETATTVEINYYCAEGLQTELSKGDGVSIRCIRKR